MKNYVKLIALATIFLSACGKTADTKTGNLDSLKNAHQALYNQAMDIHDEVMPKMNDLHALKKSLQDSLAKTPKLSAETKAALESKIRLVDSASTEMMVWMRQFKPSDSVASSAYGQYMQKELEKVRQVKGLIQNALAD